MRLSKSRILSAEQAVDQVFSFESKGLGQSQKDEFLSFVQDQETKLGSFILDEITRKRTNLAEDENRKISELVEQKVLEKLKDVQEPAYKEAYNLGLKEGRDQAFQETSQEIAGHIEQLKNVYQELIVMQTTMLNRSEIHILKTLFAIASRIAQREIKNDPSLVMPILKRLMDEAQNMSNVIIQVSPDDMKFIHTASDHDTKLKNSLAEIKLQEDESLKSGGCRLESSFGLIDASIEARCEQVWKSIEEKLPKLDEEVA